MNSLEEIGYSKAKEYSETSKEMVGLKKDMVQVVLNRNVIDKLETMFERVPQCVVLLAFVIAIQDFPKIGYAIRNSFFDTKKAGDAGGKETLYMAVFVAIALWGILKSFITERYF